MFEIVEQNSESHISLHLFQAFKISQWSVILLTLIRMHADYFALWTTVGVWYSPAR
jgi:hypothetical protein